ncbi:DUF6221 family protein [Micromonospora sp. NPDC048909]|uniref:DUF6221 family protein n=1 Tax=Micromonospora sp. NPDC048909 TaxID=3155643 RepID=UPI003410D248
MTDEITSWLRQQLENQRHTAHALKTLAMAESPETAAILRRTSDQLQADADAKARLLTGIHGPSDRLVDGTPECKGCRDLWPCTTVLYLAQPFANQLGYRSEWLP